MGKQLQIFSTEKDNSQLESFLKTNFDIELFQSFANQRDELRINNINETLFPYNSIIIWNKKFPWKLEYSTTNTADSLSYISNTHTAPVLKFSKSNFNEGIHGRIYWAKEFAGEITYNAVEFNEFYLKVISWIKKNSVGKIKYGELIIYCLNNAWIKLENA